MFTGIYYVYLVLLSLLKTPGLPLEPVYKGPSRVSHRSIWALREFPGASGNTFFLEREEKVMSRGIHLHTFFSRVSFLPIILCKPHRNHNIIGDLLTTYLSTSYPQFIPILLRKIQGTLPLSFSLLSFLSSSYICFCR
jgi:hypothetical protein